MSTIFKIKGPQNLNVVAKALRADQFKIAANFIAYKPYDLFNIKSEEVRLKPGEVSSVEVMLEGIHIDSQFTKVTAGIIPISNPFDKEANIEQNSKVNGKNYKVSVSIPTAPTSLSVKLEGGTVFWSFNNTFNSFLGYDFPDLAEEVKCLS